MSYLLQKVRLSVNDLVPYLRPAPIKYEEDDKIWEIMIDYFRQKLVLATLANIDGITDIVKKYDDAEKKSKYIFKKIATSGFIKRQLVKFTNKKDIDYTELKRKSVRKNVLKYLIKRLKKKLLKKFDKPDKQQKSD